VSLTSSIAVGLTEGAGAIRECVEDLATRPVAQQLSCLERLRRAGAGAALATRTLSDMLARSGGATDPRVIVAVLDVFRALGHRAASAAEIVRGLLPHRSSVYRERDKTVVVRLRAYALLTLSEIGDPSTAVPALLDVLAHIDERMSPVEVGAAARVVGALGSGGHQFAPYLLETIGQRFSSEEFSLERYDAAFPAGEATTVQIEAVRSLGRVCSAQDLEVVMVLRQIVSDGSRTTSDPRVVREAVRALALVASEGDPP